MIKVVDFEMFECGVAVYFEVQYSSCYGTYLDKRFIYFDSIKDDFELTDLGCRLSSIVLDIWHAPQAWTNKLFSASVPFYGDGSCGRRLEDMMYSAVWG